MAKKPTAAQAARIAVAVRTAAAHRALGTSPSRDQSGNPYASKRTVGGRAGSPAKLGGHPGGLGNVKRDLLGRFS